VSPRVERSHGRYGYRPEPRREDSAGPPEDSKKASKQPKQPKKNYDEILDSLSWGRVDEVSRLHSILGRSAINQGGLIVITGERGQGKTFMLKQAWELATKEMEMAANCFEASAKKSADDYVMSYQTLKIYDALFEQNDEVYQPAYGRFPFAFLTRLP
jgi:chromosomal replication initiation ATPase DnaA